MLWTIIMVRKHGSYNSGNRFTRPLLHPLLILCIWYFVTPCNSLVPTRVRGYPCNCSSLSCNRVLFILKLNLISFMHSWIIETYDIIIIWNEFLLDMGFPPCVCESHYCMLDWTFTSWIITTTQQTTHVNCKQDNWKTGMEVELSHSRVHGWCREPAWCTIWPGRVANGITTVSTQL